MKKLIFCFFAIAFGMQSFAQGHNIGAGLKIDLGVKAGANLSRLAGEGWEEGFNANFLGGVYLGLNGRVLGAQAEGLFVQSTYTRLDNANQLPGSFFQQVSDSAKGGSIRVNYLSIPVLLNIRLFSKAVFQLGPQYSGVVSVSDRDKLLKDAEGLFKTGTVSGVVGVTLTLGKHLNLGGRYVFGLSNVQDKDYFQQYQNYKDNWKERDIQLHVGFSF